jgi:hypothetical protein
MLDALVLLQERIQKGEGHSQVVLRAERGYVAPDAAIRPDGETKGGAGR